MTSDGASSQGGGDGLEDSPEISLDTSSSRWDAVIETVRATAWLLAFALICATTLLAIWLFDVPVPSRGIVIGIVTVCVAGPFAAAYCYLVAWRFERGRKNPVLILDEDHAETHLDWVDPEVIGEIELEGGTRIPTRRTNTGQLRVVKDLRVEQREETQMDGSTETVGKPVAEVNWQGAVSEMEFEESLRTFRAWQDEAVELITEGLDARATADVNTLKNTDQFALGILRGAEEDTFFDDPGDAFDWSVDSGGVDLEQIDPEAEASTNGDGGGLEDVDSNGNQYKVQLNQTENGHAFDQL